MIRRMIFVVLMGKLIQTYSLGLLQTETLLAVLWLAMTAIVVVARPTALLPPWNAIGVAV
jgi:hypothetical protein